MALFLANPFPEGGLLTSHRTAALLGPCQPQHSILTSMTASRKRPPLMDEAPSTRRSLLAGHRPRLPGGQPPGWSGRPRGALFAIAGRTGSQRFNGAGQRRGDPGPDPLWRATAWTCAQGDRWRNQPSTCGVTAVPTVMARRCPERLTARRPVLLAARMLARNKFLYSFSRPALRAAACGGRPRPATPRCLPPRASPFTPGGMTATGATQRSPRRGLLGVALSRNCGGLRIVRPGDQVLASVPAPERWPRRGRHLRHLRGLPGVRIGSP